MRSKLSLVLALAALFALSLAKPDFGLRKGNVWTYAVTRDGKTTIVKETAVAYVDADKNGNKALEIKAEYEGGYVGYRYLGQSERGLLSYYNGQMRGPGVDLSLKPVVLAQLPLTKGLTWKWVEPWRGQTAGEVDEEELRRLDSQESAVIVADLEPVSVPAGSFNAVHVRVTSESEGRGRRFADYWYVFGVGLVKSVHKGPDGTSERVLTSFVPAP